MFRSSWVHHRGDSCICSVVCFTCVGVSCLVDKKVSNTLTSPPDCKTYHTAYTTVSLRMDPRGSKHVADIGNEILIYKIVRFVGLCRIIVSQCTEQKKICTFSLTSALVRVVCSTPRPGRFTLGKQTRYPLYRRLNGPQSRSGRVLNWH